MPKLQQVRRIDAKKSSRSGGTVVVTSSTPQSGNNINAHELSGDKHVGFLSESQAPWAINQTEFNSHLSNANAHHNRLHSILSTSDHSISGSAYGIVGTVLDDTIGLLSISTSGDGIDVTKSGSAFTINVDVSDFIGDGLGDDGANNLYVKVKEGIEISADALRVDEDYAFDWTDNHTFAGFIGSPSFGSGFTGHGWRLDTSNSSLELQDLTVRGQMSVYELLVRQIRATNGNLFVSDTAKIYSVSGSGPYTLSVAEDDVHGFAEDDIIRAQRFTGDGTYQVNMQVTSVTNTKTFVAALISGSAPAAGMEFVRLGSISDSDRRGTIYLSASDTYSPYIDIVDGVSSISDWNTNDVLKARFGKLDGITDSDFGVLSGYGVYVKGNGYFKGSVYASNGQTVISEDYGLNLKARTTSPDDSEFGSEINWTTDAINPTSGTSIARMLAGEYTSGGYVTNNLTIEASVGNSDNRSIVLKNQSNLSQLALIGLYSGVAANRILLQSSADGGGNGSIDFVSENVTTSGDFKPTSDLGSSLGSPSYRFYELHVGTIYAGTISSVDTGHNHNDLYYSKSEVNSLVAAKADLSHTHTGYAASTHNHDTVYYTKTQLDALFSDYYEASVVDGMLAGYATVGHNHSGVYVTPGSLSSTLADYALLSDVAVDLSDYVLSSTLSTTLGDYVLTSALTSTLSGYYSSSQTDSLLSAKSNIGHTHDSLTSIGGINLTHDQSNYVNFIDDNGTYLRISSTGLESVIPSFSDGVDRSGLKIDLSGDIWARDINAVNLSTFTFERHQVSSVGTTLAVSSSGKLNSDFSLTSNGVAHTFDLKDPEAGEEQIFQPGDVVRISGIAYSDILSGSEEAIVTAYLPFPFSPYAAIDRLNFQATSFLTITEVDTSYSGFVRYTASYTHGPENISYLAGTGVVLWKGGMIILTSDSDFGPYIDMFNPGDTPWLSGTSEKYVRIGRLDGLGVVASEQYGIALGSNLDSSTASRIIASDQGLTLYKVDYTANDGTADTVSIESSGRVKFGTDISDESTTAFDFNPELDTLTIRAAADLLDGSGFAADSTLYWQANVKGSELEYAEATGGTLTDTFVFNAHGLQLVPTEYNGQTLESQFRLEVGDSVLGFGDDTATGYSWTPRITFHDPIDDKDFAVLRTINNVGASVYSPGDDIITTDLVAISDPTRSDDIGVRLTVASDYGAAASAYVGVFSRYGGFDNEVAMYGDIVNIGALGEVLFTASTRVDGDFTWTGGTDSNGNRLFFVLSDLPTSDAGLPTGALWNDAGTLKVA